MKILRYASDLHLEFNPAIERIKSLWDFRQDPGDEYYLALLGDIGRPHHPALHNFLDNVAPKYKQIFYVPGNHEYYNGRGTKLTHTSILHELDTLCSSYNNITLLNNSTATLGPLKIIGTTLWSHIPSESKSQLESAINDYRLIYKKEHFDADPTPITADDTNQWNADAIAFLQSEIAFLQSEIAQQPSIVLSHHAPLFSNARAGHYTADPKYLDGKNNYAFHNNLAHLIKPPIVAWLYGHTHYTSKFAHNGVTVATNQLGYEGEETQFMPHAYLNLDRLLTDSL